MAEKTIQLPPPRCDGKVSVEKALLARRSVRQFGGRALMLAEISQLLWAAQGVTDSRGLRTAPSAGALYPLEICLVAGQVDQLPAGIYRYRVRPHSLQQAETGDFRAPLCRAALRQGAVAAAAATIALSAIAQRMTSKYGERGIRYVHMEAGHAAQNIGLQAVALDLASVVIGAFYDGEVHRLLHLAADETPLYLIAVGKPP